MVCSPRPIEILPHPFMGVAACCRHTPQLLPPFFFSDAASGSLRLGPNDRFESVASESRNFPRRSVSFCSSSRGKMSTADCELQARGEVPYRAVVAGTVATGRRPGN